MHKSIQKTYRYADLILQNSPVQISTVRNIFQRLSYLSIASSERFLRRRELDCSYATTSPRNLFSTLLRPGIGLVEVVANPIELVSEVVERLLPLAVELLEKMLLVKDCLVALDGRANLFLEDADDFGGRLLLEVWERARG